MVAEGGAFAASLDADSEGEEGKFYVWARAEIVEVLGEADAAVFAAAYDVTRGRQLGRSQHSQPLAQSRCWACPPMRRRCAICAASCWRAALSRIRPGWDDKVLADWNGLMIAALVHAARVLDRPEWLTAAARAFHFVLQHMETGGRLIHCWRAGQAKAQATANDYANMIWAALRLFQATNESAFLTAAERWCATLDRHHWVAGARRLRLHGRR